MNWIALRTVFLLPAACAASFGDTLVVPNNQATTPGNLAIAVGANVSRLQEIVGGGQFTQPIVITGIRTRSAPGSGRVSFNYTSLKITLSTTQAYPNTNNGHTLPSTTYANNVGPDATTVYNGPYSASSPGCGAPGPCPFDLVISLATPFSYDPSKGRLLVDLMTSATTPTGSLDGVVFPDSSSSTVAIVTGDPTQAAGSPSVGGLVLGLDTGTQSGTSPSGSFGFLINASFVNPSATDGTAVLGVMNFDGAGNVTGPYTFETNGSATQPQTITGTFTGTYSNNPDGTGTVTIALDLGITATFAMVITDGGQGLQLVLTSTSCANSSNCDISGEVISGVARAAYSGSPKGSYGFQATNSPRPGASIGAISFDGAGNVVESLTFVGAGQGGGAPVNQAPIFTGTLTGTYSLNSDGSGTINFPAVPGQTGNMMYAFVMTDGGSGALFVQLNRSGNGVSFGTARLQ